MDRLQAANKQLEEDNKTMRLKYANQINADKKEQEFQMTLVLMGVEIESLRERISRRQVTEDEMRKSILEPIRKI